MDGLKVPSKVKAEYGAEVSEEREKVRFISGGTQCAAWHYPGSNGACVIMAGGFAVTKEPGTDPFAKRFNDAGFAVLAFDYRRIGESGGQPRQVLPVRDQLADWQAAIAFAATLPGVDPTRLAVWGFSQSGGHLFRVAARNPQLAAAIAQTPNADGLAASRNASRHQTPLALLRLAGRGVLDALGGLVGRQPLLVPLAGEPGTVSLRTTPDGCVRIRREVGWPRQRAGAGVAAARRRNRDLAMDSGTHGPPRSAGLAGRARNPMTPPWRHAAVRQPRDDRWETRCHGRYGEAG